ncbi:MAG: DNA-3-methyladenine glycosylase 2 family protein [Verrucomicrobia bacterium]|nr:DNA-3-methyladenine glycosylase 2 family protein [Cytophagales bacterium]
MTSIQHLSQDEILSPLIENIILPEREASQDLYLALLRSVVSQQLSVKAAATIFKRFLQLFENEYPEATQLLQIDNPTLRNAGLSAQKTAYLKNIATFYVEKGLDYQTISQQTDEELIAYLTEIKGIGKWTVEMLLMFTLNRPDVFPADDLGIQNAMKKLYQLSASGKLLKKKMLEIAEKWQPYRTTACLYLWHWKDN